MCRVLDDGGLLNISSAAMCSCVPIDVAFELRQIISGREAGLQVANSKERQYVGRNWKSTTGVLLWVQIQYKDVT